jgi:uncharacterized lipoprotein
LWDTGQGFLAGNRFIVVVERPDAGVMETDWAEDRAKIGSDIIRNTLGKLLDSLYSTGERDKFRTRFEPGCRARYHRYFHQPSRHGRGLHLVGQGRHPLAAAPAGSGTWKLKCCVV